MPVDFKKIINGTILKIENGENGVESAIIVSDEENIKYLITISNSNRFLISIIT